MIKEAAIRFDGTVYRGRRHGNIFKDNSSVSENGVIVSSIAAGEQGFVDDKGNFLTREHAAQHALACGQVEALRYSKTQLFSEDLW